MRVSLLAGLFLLSLLLFRKNRKIPATVIFVISSYLIAYYDSVHEWLTGLGTDSLSEAQNFDWNEAWFLLRSLPSVFTTMPVRKWLETMSIAIAAVLLVWLLARLLNKYLFSKLRFSQGASALIFLVAIAAIATPVYRELARASVYFESNSVLYERARANFNNSPSYLGLNPNTDKRNLNLVLYIGESTTSANWSLYGYPITTTPKLQSLQQADNGLLVFNNFLSTHTHTSQSLLEALSFPLSESDAYTQILARQRVSLIDVVNYLNIPAYLVTTQGQTGTFNLASSIIFSGITDKDIFQKQSKLLGNMGTVSRVDEKEYFLKNLDLRKQLNDDGAYLALVHSYIGHGPYNDALPLDKQFALNKFFDGASSADIFGSKLKKPVYEDLSGYESAMRYVDDSLAAIISRVSTNPKPSVFIYFSDHGESSLTQSEHDSARFQHEMIRIPFIMYFNSAAMQAYPDLYHKYKKAAQGNKIHTLAQLSTTVLDIFGFTVPTMENLGLAESGAVLNPVVVRQIAAGSTYVRTSNGLKDINTTAKDVTDAPTTIWLNSKRISGNRQALCYGNANSWAKAARGAIVADCVGAVLGQHGSDLVVLPSNNDWLVGAILDLTSSYKIQAYFNAANIEAQFACSSIASKLEKSAGGLARASTVYLKLNSKDKLVGSCKQLQGIGVNIFYQDDTKPIIESVDGHTRLVENYEADDLPYSAVTPGKVDLLVLNTDWDMNTQYAEQN